jgi:hypothetical protein
VMQFPSVGVTLERLRDQSGHQGRQSFDSAYDLLREAVRRAATKRSKAFLLVLDTMELVQSDPDSLAGVIDFVEKLTGSGFTELRIVAAGRADVPELRRDTKQRRRGQLISLGPLSVKDGRDMAQRLGHALLGDEWNPTWAQRIVGGPNARPLHREPLAIRVAVEFLRSAEADEREGLALEIETMHEKSSSVDFVGRLYERRVLDHVRSKAAGKLAWPGLVARLLTQEIAEKILAPLCGLSQDEVGPAFNALAREVWIVQREGLALRHRADLRARTLPLMRVRDENLFQEVAHKLAAYFGERSASSLADKTEWIYYRLLAGEDPSRVDADWDERLAPGLRTAANDFEPMSSAAAYLKARTSARLLPRETIDGLPISLAWDHVARAGAALRRFDDQQIKFVALDLMARDEELGSITQGLRPDAALTRSTIAIKVGFWTRIHEYPELRPATLDDHVFAHMFLAARALPEGQLVDWAHQSATFLWRAADPALWRERLPTVIQGLAVSRRHQFDSELQLDHILEHATPSDITRWGSTASATLRTAVVFGSGPICFRILEWALSAEPRGGGKVFSSFSLAELAALVQADAISADRLHVLARDASIPGVDLGTLTLPDRSQPRRVTDPRIVEAATRAVHEMCARADSPKGRHHIRRWLAARDEDWLMPMAYAAARAVGLEGVPQAAFERVEGYSPQDRSLFNRIRGDISQSVDRTRRDPIRIMRLADEASDLRGMADLFLSRASDKAGAEDLRKLLAAHREWREIVGAMVDAEPTA